MLTHGPGNVVVGHSTVFEDPNMLYLIHLPKDILRTILMVNMQGSGLGGDVNIIDFEHYIVGIAEFVYDVIVAGANALINFATVMVNLGLAVINGLGQLGSAAIQTVVAATKVVVDAFNAFVAWAVQFVSDSITSIFGPITQAINNAWTAY